MLPRWSSPTPFAGVLVEHECPRCHRAVELPLGALCGSCMARIERRAAKWGNLTALITTALLAGYVVASIPRDSTARTVGTMAVVIWFMLSNVIVRRAVREFMR
jgi:hypothetical protein